MRTKSSNQKKLAPPNYKKKYAKLLCCNERVRKVEIPNLLEKAPCNIRRRRSCTMYTVNGFIVSLFFIYFSFLFIICVGLVVFALAGFIIKVLKHTIEKRIVQVQLRCFVVNCFHRWIFENESGSNCINEIE